MDIYRKIQLSLLTILILTIGVFGYLMFSWNFARNTGTVTTDDGTYIGEFKGKIFDGQGTFVFSNGVKYDGSWVNGVMDGYGIMTFANGAKYEGGFSKGRYSGNGQITQADGTTTEGIWENGKLKERK